MKRFDAERAPCPFLPLIDEVIGAAAMREMGRERGTLFYLRALECAQSLWRQALPAQSVLLLNRAFGADLEGDEPVLEEWPLPYAAMRWVLSSAREGDFIGNPRRHFQHLATRMVEPRREIRSWRAWACWRYAREIFPELPPDQKQLDEEGVREPTVEEIREGLVECGICGEAALWEKVKGER